MRIIDFIMDMREKCGRIGKNKTKIKKKIGRKI